ncbi:MAG: molybdopterin-dependent oxidoreductase [Burkholderiaceae bacterium]
MSRLSLMIDLERCIGCKSCEAACKAEHGLGPGEYRNRVVWLGDTDQAGLDFFTLSCQHCERPACLRACPVLPKAITKDAETGVVAIDESRCTGCGECVIACPYGAMGYDAKDHHAIKCDLCAERRSAGRRPACATVCPGEAIRFGEREAHLEAIGREARRALDHDAFLLGPANIYLERLRDRPAMAGAVAPPPAAARRIAQGHRPRVVDDPERNVAIASQAIRFPYRSDRERRQADTIVPGGCNICFNCCPTEYHLRDGKVVRVTGNEADPLWKGKVCPKSQFLLQLYNSDKRLTQPLKRVGARGEGRFVPIGWDQALDEIAAKLVALRDAYGPETLGIFAGTRTGTLTRRGYILMFQQLWGTPNYSDTEAFCSESKRVAYMLTQGANGSGNSYTPTDLGTAALYVYFGDNQAESRPVHFGMVNDWRIKNGARMIVVDPRLNVTASKADLWLPIRSGTDWALALALAHHIFTTGQHDQAFCETWVLGWERWRDYVFEKGYSPEWAADVTSLPSDAIRALGDEIARADGCVIFGGRGLNQHANGAQTNRALMFLAAITGNWGRKGGTFQNYGTASPAMANAPPERRAPMTRPSLGNNPTSWLEAMLAGTPYPMRAMITCNNPMSAWPGQDRLRDAFKSLDLLVHIELFANETSRFADYVLPAATGIEKGEIGRAAEDRRVIWIDKVIDPPGQAWPDGWIWIELGKRLGFDDVLRDEYKDSALFWDAEMIAHPEMRGCTQKRLHEAPTRWVRVPLFHEDDAEIETLYLEGTTAPGAPQGHRFPTPSGKLEFWTAALDARFRDMGLDALPEFYTDREQLIDLPWVEAADLDRAPLERAGSAWRAIQIRQPDEHSPSRQLRARGFDTELITGRPAAAHFHSWTHYAWQAQEMWPDLYVQIHPQKARLKGIEDGDEVVVETAHGTITARAWLHAGIREQTVFVPIGWDAAQPFHPWRSVNYLTDHQQRDPVSGHSNLKTYLCRISKA